ncbi:MAG: exodeoxyribonuclease VII small subunit, partial [Candidatus Methanoperedenaceae archaeon]|nr:exodeoxyribonuclease VII small subunit [Candidatus Methanoperedenaceae archaeon]
MEISFEESLSELEGIVEKLEKGQLSLDESLMLFEKGIKLVRECNTKLK